MRPAWSLAACGGAFLLYEGTARPLHLSHPGAQTRRRREHMDYLLKNMVIHPDADDRCLQGDLLVQAGRIAAMGPGRPAGAMLLR